MAKQSVSKKYSINATGVLNIDDDGIFISVEDVGDFNIAELLSDFNGCNVKLSCSYDEEQCAPEIYEETGEVLE